MNRLSESQLPLAVTMGDPCGIGPDLIVSVWANRRKYGLPRLFVVGSQKVLMDRANRLGLKTDFQEGLPSKLESDALHVVEISEVPHGKPGEPTSADARAALEAIDKAVELNFQGRASGVVTCPVNKKTLYGVGFSHPGHTEYLAELGGKYVSDPIYPVMMIAGPKLRTIPVTIHIPLVDVTTVLSQELVETTCRTAARDLRRYFGIDAPRLVVSGLNPHAGEAGSLGSEDQEIIEPAIDALRKAGMNIRGPLPADTMFHEKARQSYDVAICMYHDQALIPAKTIGFDDAVNVTLGLPFIRTSPDHGTAYDIAGTGRADPSSFLAALDMAAEMANYA